jgi:hypothetical protein
LPLTEAALDLEPNAKIKKSVRKTKGIVFISSEQIRAAKPGRSCESGPFVPTSYAK